MLGHHALKESNVLEQLKMIKILNIQNLNEKVGAVDVEWKLNKNLFFDAVSSFYFKRVLTSVLNLENYISLAQTCSHIRNSCTSQLWILPPFWKPLLPGQAQHKELFKHSVVSRGLPCKFRKINPNLLHQWLKLSRASLPWSGWGVLTYPLHHPWERKGFLSFCGAAVPDSTFSQHWQNWKRSSI